MNSLRLSSDWDITLTPGGDLDVVTDPERVPQDVSTYVRTFQGECWYAQDDGIPYLDGELARLPPAGLVTERARRRAMEVPGVALAEVTLTRFEQRVLHGEIAVRATEEAGGRAVNVVF